MIFLIVIRHLDFNLQIVAKAYNTMYNTCNKKYMISGSSIQIFLGPQLINNVDGILLSKNKKLTGKIRRIKYINQQIIILFCPRRSGESLLPWTEKKTIIMNHKTVYSLVI